MLIPFVEDAASAEPAVHVAHGRAEGGCLPVEAAVKELIFWTLSWDRF